MITFNEFVNEGKIIRIPTGFVVKVKGYPFRGIKKYSYFYGSSNNEFLVEFPQEIKDSNKKADNSLFLGRKVSKLIELNRIKKFYWNTTETFPIEIDPEFQRKFDNGEIFQINFSDNILSLLRGFLCTESIYYGDMNYIDITDKNDMISYVPKNKLDKIGRSLGYTDPWSNKYRQEIKVSQLFKNIYWDISPKYLEKLVNMYKSEYDFKYHFDESSFELVEGEDIRYWYSGDNYVPGGTLGNSCMRSPKYGYKFNVYVDNPDKIKLLILKNKSGKLLARALVWYLDYPEGKVYMDRVYHSRDYLQSMFYKYANKRGWWNYDSNGDMKVFIKKDYGDRCKYPYMDTFNRLYLNRNGKVFLSNNYNWSAPGFEYQKKEVLGCF